MELCKFIGRLWRHVGLVASSIWKCYEALGKVLYGHFSSTLKLQPRVEETSKHLSYT